MSQWWRAYNGAVDHPKLCLLSDRAHRGWFNLMCLASENGGELPSMEIMSLKLRMSPSKVAVILAELVSRRLIDKQEDGTMVPHKWNDRQYKNDVTDPTNAVRQKRYRDRHRNAVTTVTEPLRSNDQRQSTESETERKEDDAPSGAPPKYVFESGVIRLNQKNFNQWKEAFSHLDLKAELLGLTEWANKQGNNWFCAVSGALAKRNRDVGVRVAAGGKAEEFKYASGIPGVV